MAAQRDSCWHLSITKDLYSHGTNHSLTLSQGLSHFKTTYWSSLLCNIHLNQYFISPSTLTTSFSSLIPTHLLSFLKGYMVVWIILLGFMCWKIMFFQHIICSSYGSYTSQQRDRPCHSEELGELSVGGYS